MVLSSLVSEYLCPVQGAIIIIALLRHRFTTSDNRRLEFQGQEKPRMTRSTSAHASAVPQQSRGERPDRRRSRPRKTEFTIARVDPAATHGWTAGVVYHAERAEDLRSSQRFRTSTFIRRLASSAYGARCPPPGAI